MMSDKTTRGSDKDRQISRWKGSAVAENERQCERAQKSDDTAHPPATSPQSISKQADRAEVPDARVSKTDLQSENLL
ncbi:hypothetical protein [Rhizobium sp. KDH_Rht_773_N]